MAVLQTADGRLLTRSRPQRADRLWFGGGQLASTWTDAHPDGDDDSRALASYARIYRSQPWVAAAVNKLARQIGTLPLKVYRRSPDGAKERVSSSHPLARLLYEPLPRRSAVHVKQWMVFPLLLHGNALLGKVRAEPDGPPVNLLPLDWPSISAYAAQGEFIEMWSTLQFGQERFIDVAETLHFGWQGPDGTGEVGVSPLEQLGTTIQLEDAAQRQQTAAFRNGIFPSIAVSLGEKGSNNPEVANMTRTALEGLHKGPDRAFRALLLSPGTEVKPLAISARDAELIETRKLNRQEVATCYDLPPPLLGDLESATLANMREFGRQFYTDIVRPWLTLIEETIKAQLIDSEPWDEDGLSVEFDLAEQLKGEPKELAETLRIQIESGLMTPNEGRALLNLSPDGDSEDPENPANKLYLPVNNLQPIGTETNRQPQIVEGEPARALPPPSPPQAL